MTHAQLARLGFVFDGFRGFIPADDAGRAKLAQDAALVTMPNSAMPAEFSQYIDPKVIEVLTSPRKAKAVTNEVKKGDWTTSQAKFPMDEITGGTNPYSDFTEGGVAGNNFNFENRDNYLFETTVIYGDRETAVAATGKLNLASKRQMAASTIIDIDANEFYLRGVAGKRIFGLLNDPSLPAAVAPIPNAGSDVEWADKTNIEIYDDIIFLFNTLVKQADGWIDKDTPLTLIMSPELSTYLARTSQYNENVQKLLDTYFAKLKIVTIPQLASDTGETMMLIADELLGQKTVELAYSEKVRAMRLIAKESSYRQKWLSGTYGAIYYRPVAVATMRGM